MRHSRALRRGTGVALLVLLIALAGWLAVPHGNQATASLSVTPRADSGVPAARLLADRYVQLARSVDVLDAALTQLGAQAPDISAADLQQDVDVRWPGEASTIEVTATLPDRAGAVRVANAVVAELVAEGAGEELVDVRPASAAVSEAVTSTPSGPVWAGSSLAAALVLGLGAAALAGRLPAGTVPSRGVAATPDRAVDGASAHALGVAGGPGADVPSGPGTAVATQVDDLGRFRDHPPGSPATTVTRPEPAALASAAPAPAVPKPAVPKPAVPEPAALEPAGADPAALAPMVPKPVAEPGHGPAVAPPPRNPSATASRARAATAAGLLALALGGGGIVTLAVADDDGDSTARGPESDGGADASGAAPSTAGETADSAPTTAPTPPPAAGALADVSVAPGEGGGTARVAVGGIVLEQRAVGVTVAYPVLDVSTDGTRSVTHVQFTTYNCIASQPPADPVAGGCSPATTEYADSDSADVEVTRDRLTVAATLPTYTRPTDGPAMYTGRQYAVSATLTPGGAGDGGQAVVTGELSIGPNSAPVAGGENVLQLPR